MLPLDCAHCLYPTFTQRLLRRLADERRSVNLIGLPGDGRRRAVEDLCRIAPLEIKLLRVNCHDWRKNYPGFIAHLWRGLGLNHDKKPPEDLAGLMESLENAGAAWLILEEFDNLTDVPDAERDPRYNLQFFNSHLNSLKNLPNLCLLTVTNRPRQECVFLCEGQNTSPPDLEPETLPPLGEPELRAELQRCLPSLDTTSLTLAVDSLYKQKHSRYARLEHVAAKLENNADAELRIAERLQRWQREFDPLRDKINLGSTNRVMRWLRVRLRVIFNWTKGLLSELLLFRSLLNMLCKLCPRLCGNKPKDKP